jgi:hypothetical protein
MILPFYNFLCELVLGNPLMSNNKVGLTDHRMNTLDFEEEGSNASRCATFIICFIMILIIAITFPLSIFFCIKMVQV